MEIITTSIGIVGVITLLIAYVFLQLGKLAGTGFGYSFLNLIGSLMILVSLNVDWNLPAVIIEIAWALVSLLGIWRWWKRRS